MTRRSDCSHRGHRRLTGLHFSSRFLPVARQAVVSTVILFWLTCSLSSSVAASVQDGSAKEASPQRPAVSPSLDSSAWLRRAKSLFGKDDIEFQLLQKTATTRQLVPIFEDTFEEDSREAYRVKGEVLWQPGRLTLQRRTTLKRSLAAGRRARCELRLALPEITEENPEHRLRWHFDRSPRFAVDFEGAPDFYLEWRLLRGQPRPQATLALVTYTSLAGFPVNEQVIKRVDLPWPLPEAWTVEYRQAQVSVASLNGKTWKFALPSPTALLEASWLESMQQPLTLTSWSCVATERGEYGPDQLSAGRVGATLSQRAKGHFDKGELRIAQRLTQDSLAALTRAYPIDSVEIIYGLRNSAWGYLAMGDLQRARLVTDKALELSRLLFGEDHPEHTYTLGLDARLHRDFANYFDAARSSQQAIAIIRRHRGNTAPELAQHLIELAVTYHSLGNLAKSESTYEEVLELKRRRDEVQDGDYLTGLSNLANLYQNQGRYDQALRLYEQVRKRLESDSSSDQLFLAYVLGNLGTLHDELGDINEARRFYAEGLLLVEQAANRQHPLYRLLLNNLASWETNRTQFDSARRRLLEIYELEREQFGEQHPNCAQVLLNLVSIDGYQGRHQKVLERVAKIEAILREQGPAGYELLATALKQKAQTLCLLERSAEGLSSIREATQLAKQAQGTGSELYRACLSDLAAVEAGVGELEAALEHAQEVMRVSRESLQVAAGFQSEQQQRIYQQGQRSEMDRYLRIARLADIGAEDLYTELLQWKGGVALRQARYRQQAALPEAESLLRELQRVSSALSHWELTPPRPPREAPASVQKRFQQAQTQRLDELRQEQRELQQELARVTNAAGLSSPELRQVTVDDIQRMLPPQVALIDFVVFTTFGHMKWEWAGGNVQDEIGAFVVHRDGVEFILLGKLDEELLQQLSIWRNEFDDSDRGRTAAYTLKQRLWNPLADALGERRQVLISTDGELGLLPFAALPGDESGRYLVESFTISYLPIPRLLVQPHRSTQRVNVRDLVAFGGVEYAAVDADAVSATKGEATTSHSGGFSPLPATQGEVETLAAIRQTRSAAIGSPPNVKLLLGTQASEASFRELAPLARYVHVATHGFVRVDEAEATADHATRLASEAETANRSQATKAKKVFAGIALAGANRAFTASSPSNSGENDGLLTAKEISFLHFPNTELVTVSACDSALGEVTRGEGLVGLQRAFQIAGAESTLTTLWKVEDQATAELMTLFYRNLWEGGMSRTEALRQAQLAMLNHYQATTRQWRDGWGSREPVAQEKLDASAQEALRKLSSQPRLSPRFWAAFVLSGAGDLQEP